MTTTTSRQAISLSGERGFSLVELMISAALGLVLVAGVITAMTGGRQSSDTTNAIVQVMDNMHFVHDLISTEIRQSGYQGCANIASGSAVTRASDSPTESLAETMISGSTINTDGSWLPAPYPTFTIPDAPLTPVPETDVLMVQYGSDSGLMLVNDMPTSSDDLTVRPDATINVQVDDLVLVSNCEVADIIRLSSVAPDANGNLTLTYSPDVNKNAAMVSTRYSANSSFVRSFMSSIYFMGETDRTDSDGNTINALYRQTLPYTSAPVEVISGIDSFRVMFGIIDEDGNMIFASPSDAHFDPASIASVNVGMLLKSDTPTAVLADTKTYNVAGYSVIPGNGSTGMSYVSDKYTRSAFNFSVSIRNRR